ncbi:hypothetical protein ISF_07502 [Cordyceps fumosorosea ARSEF 2679]|uniref:Uncharacterized protein n=1 Tax=Cordyceps fumosorosea (strain ARSEF 2679) TaxID=1081104 RepID=A0A167P9Q9_CORFA|nr:hypothetical protein ISF_07502 [Cordyceps fumosorosea ARSEF 2679]OAA56434.1 hypothetical protein ISF_07502 [Cordyceps fumosorosea ARSEF 2679]
MFFECNLKKERHERRGRCRGDDDDYGRRGHREQRCGKPGCREKCAYSKTDGMKVYASYCCDHACLLGAHRCRLMKERNETYCHIHATCTAAGCLAKADRLSTKTLPWFCDRHKCTYPGCASFAERGGRCATHAGGALFCSAGGCSGLCGPNSPFCELHAAERGGGPMPMPMPMQMPGHNMAQGWNGPPPPPHAGMMPAPPFFEGVPGAFPAAAQPGVHQCDMHCTEHRHSNKASQPESFCRTPGCHRLRRASGDGDWCENRELLDIITGPPPGAFCRVHGCAADTCARFREAGGGWFCAEHECRRPRCLERVAPGAGCCPRHLNDDGQEEEEEEEQRRREGGGRERYQQRRHAGQACDGLSAPRVVIVQGDAVAGLSPGCRCGGRQQGRRHRRNRSLSSGEDEDGYGYRCEGSCDRVGGRFRRVYYDD